MRLKNVLVLMLLVVVIFFLSGCTQSAKPTTEQTPNTDPVVKTEVTTTSEDPVTKKQDVKENTVEITASGFNPQTLTVNSGDVVSFLNKDTALHWPASALHPTHNVYPEPGGCVGSKFDACQGLNKDEVFAFKFNQKGTWKYHDHLNPSLFGTIIVK